MSSKSVKKLQDKLKQSGIVIDLDTISIPERAAYKNALKAVEEATDEKSRAKALKYLKLAEQDYTNAFQDYVAEVYPNLLYQIGEDKIFWDYEEGVGCYRELHYATVRGFVSKLLKDEGMRTRSTDKNIRDILVRLRGEYQDRGRKEEDFMGSSDWLHVQNGWINVKTGAFEDHSPSRLSLSVIPIKYDKKAQCPVWIETVNHLADNDPTQAKILQEFVGYCLTYDTKFDKSLILVGEGQSGKSTFANTVYNMLGQENTASIDLESINEMFGTVNLIGKRLNWIDEMPTTKYLESQHMKRLISGEPTTAQRKYREAIQFIPTAKFLWTMNEMPRLADTTNGSYRRFIIVECNNVYTEDDKDPDIDVKLNKELSGILNWAIEGLKSLYARGDFEVSAKNETAIHEYRKDNSPLLDFIDTCFDTYGIPQTITSSAGGISALSLYTAYRAYCMDTGRKPKSLTYFGRELTSDLKHIGYSIVKHRFSDGVFYFGIMPNGNKDGAKYHDMIGHVQQEIHIPDNVF